MSDQETMQSTGRADAMALGAREQAALEALVELCDKTTLDLRPEAREVQGQYLQIELVGDDALATFGRNGKSLDALQYLANLIVGRRTGGEVRILLDAGNYRARRQETLENLAREYANMVKERQEECEFDPLPAHERRIVHNALASDDSIRTYSEGDDPDRRVIIAPR
jgi:spoIIIJ-associated protein